MRKIAVFAGLVSSGFISASALGQQPVAAPPPSPAATPAQPEAAAPVAPVAPAPAAASPAATAEPVKESGEEPFGKAGVINIASDLTLNIEHVGYSAPSGVMAPASVTEYQIGPAADVFVIDNLSVGALVLFGRTASSAAGVDVKFDVISLEPRVGYHIPFVPGKLGLWPKTNFFYEHTKVRVTGAPDSTLKAMGIGIFVPLLIHPVEHFHIGIGPYFSTELSAKLDGQDDAKATSIGLRAEIGGWWKL